MLVETPGLCQLTDGLQDARLPVKSKPKTSCNSRFFVLWKNVTIFDPRFFPQTTSFTPPDNPPEDALNTDSKFTELFGALSFEFTFLFIRFTNRFSGPEDCTKVDSNLMTGFPQVF
jgi:hypothetical protein